MCEEPGQCWNLGKITDMCGVWGSGGFALTIHSQEVIVIGILWCILLFDAFCRPCVLLF